MQKAMKYQTGSDIKISKSQIKNIVSIGKGLQIDKSRQRRSIPDQYMYQKSYQLFH